MDTMDAMDTMDTWLSDLMSGAPRCEPCIAPDSGPVPKHLAVCLHLWTLCTGKRRTGFFECYVQIICFNSSKSTILASKRLKALHCCFLCLEPDSHIKTLEERGFWGTERPRVLHPSWHSLVFDLKGWPKTWSHISSVRRNLECNASFREDMCELEKQTSIRQTDANHLTRSKQTQWPNECPNLQLSVQLVSSPFKRVGRLVDPRVPSASEVRDRLPPLRVDGTILKCLLGLDLHQSQDVLTQDQGAFQYRANKNCEHLWSIKPKEYTSTYQTQLEYKLMCSISQTSSTTPSFRVISGLISCPVLSGSFPDFLAFCHSLTYLVDDGYQLLQSDLFCRFDKGA